MPKVVDHDPRRQELAEATWRLIRREGLEAVSVRKVAREAGVSPGSLRHYFTSQSELLAYALRMVGERIEQRIRSLEPGQTLEDHVQALIEQVLPLDEERATEAVIWLAFVGKALVDPELAKLATETHNALYHLFHQLIKAMVRHGALPRETDVELEAVSAARAGRRARPARRGERGAPFAPDDPANRRASSGAAGGESRRRSGPGRGVNAGRSAT